MAWKLKLLYFYLTHFSTVRNLDSIITVVSTAPTSSNARAILYDGNFSMTNDTTPNSGAILYTKTTENVSDVVTENEESYYNGTVRNKRSFREIEKTTSYNRYNPPAATDENRSSFKARSSNCSSSSAVTRENVVGVFSVTEGTVFSEGVAVTKRSGGGGGGEDNSTNWLVFALVVRDYVTPAVAGFGLCGNAISFVVWSAAPGFHPTVFLMKGLAVSDSGFLVYSLVKCLSSFASGVYNDETVYVALSDFGLFSRIVGANTTMLLVFSRWIAVRRPMRVAALLTRRRVVGAYALSLLWGAAFALVDALLSLLYFSRYVGCANTGQLLYTCATSHVKRTVTCAWLSFPTVVTVCLNVSLVRIMCEHRAKANLVQHQKRFQQRSKHQHQQQLQQQQQQPQQQQEQQQQEQTRPQQQQQHTDKASHQVSRFHRLLVAVFFLSLTSVLSNPVAAVVQAVVIFKHDVIEQQCGEDCGSFFYFSSILLEVLNSSINVVFYLAFASQFRQLFRQKIRSLVSFCVYICRCSCRRGNAE